MSQQQTKQDFAKWFLSLGGALAWFGSDKMNAWANGQIGSVVYDDLYNNHFLKGDTAYVIAYVQMHTGQAMPDKFQGWKNNTVYAPVITLLQDDLAHYQGQQQNIHGTADDTPLANQTISNNVVRTQQALAYYMQLATQ